MTMPSSKYFFIKNKLNNQVLTIEGGQPLAGAMVTTSEQKLEEDASDQLWWIHVLSGTIRSKLNGYCLELKGDTLVVHPYEERNENQKLVVSIDRIQCVANPNRVLAVSESKGAVDARVCGLNHSGLENQQWDFENSEPHFFYIQSKLNDRVADVQGGKPGNRVVMYHKHDPGHEEHDCQLWYEGAGGIIHSKIGDLALDSSADDIRLQPYDQNNPYQQWEIDVDQVERRSKPGNVMTIRGSSIADGAPLCVKKNSDAVSQQWRFLPA